LEKPPLESGWIDRTDSPERPGSWAFQLALCLLGPLFFVSYMFTILAPLPFLYLHVGTPNVRKGRIWSIIGLFLGLGLSFAIHGWLWGSLFFFLFASLPALVLGELLLKRVGPERAIVGAVLAVTVASASSAWVVAHSRGLELIPALKTATEQIVRESAERFLEQQDKSDIPEHTLEELKLLKEAPGAFFSELPGILGSLLLLLCALPCVALIRWNPKGFLRRTGIPRDFLRRWRTPDWFVWFALYCGAFLLFEVPYLSEVARNILKPILLIYFFQGMSILAYFLDSLRLRGPFRVIFYGTAIVFLTPMVVSFGFFDLWFNFRGRGRPTDEEKES
jgi:uncharacterized protein YybS (DUF2232 family)